MTRIPAYRPPAPVALPAIYLPAETAWTIVNLRRGAADIRLLASHRENTLRHARELAEFYLIPRPVLS